MFAGSIVDVKLNIYSHDRTLITWSIECDDYTSQLDKMLVVETYEEIPADEIFRDIVNKYCPDFTVTGVNTGTPEVEMIVFRSEEHTSELQSRFDLVCRLLLEKKKT